MKIATDYDSSVNLEIQQQITLFLHERELGDPPLDLKAGELLSHLVFKLRQKDKEATLLILVDEYDKPIRDVLFGLMTDDDKETNMNEAKLKSKYPNYCGIFSNCKTAQARCKLKIWLTGIAPIGMNVISTLDPDPITFERECAGAVGLLAQDVDAMIEAVHNYMPFDSEDLKQEVIRAVAVHFNNINYFGVGLYHTGMVNNLTRKVLLQPTARRAWLADLDQHPDNIKPEEVPSSVFEVIKRAKNLRPIASRLPEGQAVTGYALNKTMKLNDMVNDHVTVDNYLTLLVYLGMVSANDTGTGYVFRSRSMVYRNRHLKPLLELLVFSLVELVKLKSKKDIYSHGPALLADFTSTLSETRMERMIEWAKAQLDNHILEMQLQCFMVEELHHTLNKDCATTTQEEQPPGSKKRKDITIASDDSIVVLELKKENGAAKPTRELLDQAHDQLQEYVECHERDEATKSTRRDVAGFIVVMYNDGQNFVIEPLRRDNPLV